MGKASPSADIQLLRRHARALGVSIRTARTSKSHPDPAYDLIDSSSGQVLYTRVSRAEAERGLRAIAADRARPRPVGEHERCPTCGTPRLGNFRWCKSCGSDFKPYKGGEQLGQWALPTEESPRFCESCGADQRLVQGGGLTKTSEGDYLCSGCALLFANGGDSRKATSTRNPNARRFRWPLRRSRS
jgi:hypothetical protein